MILYFDTETTGLRPGNICQLSYVMQDSVNVTAKNFFFTVDFVEPSAQYVHGFSVQDLFLLSNGRRFCDNLDEIKNDFKSAKLIVSHNFNFDFMFMHTEFENYGDTFLYNESLCSMKYFTPICKLLRSNGINYKYPKLTELCDYLDIYTYDITKKTNELYDIYVLNHDARFDTTALFLAMNKGKEVFEDLNAIFEEYL